MFLWCKGEYKIASIHYKLRDVNKLYYKQKIEKQGGIVSFSESEKYLGEILLVMSLEENTFVCADMVENKNYVQKDMQKLTWESFGYSIKQVVVSGNFMNELYEWEKWEMILTGLCNKSLLKILSVSESSRGIFLVKLSHNA